MAKTQKNYRLGIDLGSTSLGWCMLELSPENNPTGIINMGVRIFPDGREMDSHEPLAVKRRGYRGQRRNLDRYLLRVRGLINYLLENGFLPEDQRQRDEVFKINPYYLRSKALDEELSPAEFARALIHLAKRRGYKSNRKALRTEDDGKKIKAAIENLRNTLDDTKYRTLGEYLWHRYNQMKGSETKEVSTKEHHLRKPVKFRYKDDEDASPILPTRDMVEREFDAIWSAQSGFNQSLTDEHRENVRQIIFHQRPLKPTEKGKCELEPTEERAPKAHPLFQEVRILQNLNHIKVAEVFTGQASKLSDEQYRTLYDMLHTKSEVKFEDMRKKLWGKQAEDYRFNLETEKTKKLPGNALETQLRKKHNAELKLIWENLSFEAKSRVVEILIQDSDDEQKIAELQSIGISSESCGRFLDLELPDGYGRMSLKAMHKILPFLRQKEIYSEACRLAGYDHSEEYDGRIFEEGDLPYYGELLTRETIKLNRKIRIDKDDEFGKINNPTVHVALNQLCKLVNALCKRYGAPQEIVLELGKEAPMSAKKRKELIKAMNTNEEQNEDIATFLRNHNQYVTRTNMLKVKLWRELCAKDQKPVCVYSGDVINVENLFSPNIEIDHILPKSRTYDDTTANKVLCTREANQAKGERTPYEAFHDSPGRFKWDAILVRANRLNRKAQKWRFQSDAMENFADENKLLERMLNDTRYMSRVAMKYMWYVCGKNNVWAVTGRHTGILRDKWGLNTALGETDAKERADHRHHAIDAFVIALTTRSLVKHVSERLASTQYRQIELLDPPWPGFSHAEFRERVNAILVSYKPDQIKADKLGQRYQTGGALMDQTAYGFVKGPDGNPAPDSDNPKNRLYTLRRDITDITLKNWQDIVRCDLKKKIGKLAEGKTKEEFKAAIKEWGKKNNIKKIKVTLSMNPAVMIPIRDQEGRIFKYMSSGNNLFADVFIKDPTDPDCKWDIEIVSSYAAHQPGFVPQWKRDYPKGKKVMRVFKNDVIAVDRTEKEREFRRLKKMTNGILYLREIHVAKKPKELEDIGEQYSAKRLQELRARKAGADITGWIFDPIVNEK